VTTTHRSRTSRPQPPTSAQLSVRQIQIAAVARELLDDGGSEALTMRAVAARLGIRAPSLYKHVEDKDALEALVIADVFRTWGAELHAAMAAVPARAGARRRLGQLASVYRAWALAHPHLYRLLTEGPLPRERLPVGLEAWAAEPVVAAAGGPDLVRAAWAFAHGMTILELDGRFPAGADLDAAWSAGVDALATLVPRGR
jgi:AcrR family transcriptional regulator